jgi:hypothetical protein
MHERHSPAAIACASIASTRNAKGEAMHSKLKLTSIILFMALSLFLMAFGVLYATVQNLLWFHAAAVPVRALEDVRPLYFALMTLIGGASFGLGLLGAYVTLVPIRRGAPHAALFLAAANAIALIMAAITAEKLAHATGAPTSWHIMGILMAINLTALGLNAAATRNR